MYLSTPIMLRFFKGVRKAPQILGQLKQYQEWKALRFPIAADSQYRELLRFVKSEKVSTLEDINLDVLDRYLDKQPSTHYRNKIAFSLKYFLKYCKLMGYSNAQLITDLGRIRMDKVHYLLDVDNVVRVKKLRAHIMEDGKPMSFRAIKTFMETRDNRKYDLHQIYRWSKYKLPEEG